MTQDDYLDRRVKESIHSGHFMVSDIDDSEEHTVGDVVANQGGILPQNEQDGPPRSPTNSGQTKADMPYQTDGFNFQSACKETAKTYKFGSRSSQAISIDASLSRLFQCMTLTYSGKLTSPRWKNFKGMKLRWKEKIRLNNVIWRAWHMQFVVRTRPVICQFATPIENEGHYKPEAVVLEGKYWKRKMDNVIAEYKNWRIYYKLRKNNVRDMDIAYDSSWKNRKNIGTPAIGLTLDDDALMDFTDTLFSSLSQPFASPNYRDITRSGGLADFIQPGLAQLQPNLDDFMDTFEPLADLLSFKHLLQEDSLTADSSQRSFPDLRMTAELQPDIYPTVEPNLPSMPLMPQHTDNHVNAALKMTQQTNVVDSAFKLTQQTNIIDDAFKMTQPTDVVDNALKMTQPTNFAGASFKMMQPTDVVDSNFKMTQPTNFADASFKMVQPTDVVDNDFKMKQPTSVVDNDFKMTQLTNVADNDFKMTQPTNIVNTSFKMTHPTNVVDAAFKIKLPTSPPGEFENYNVSQAGFGETFVYDRRVPTNAETTFVTTFVPCQQQSVSSNLKILNGSPQAVTMPSVHPQVYGTTYGLPPIPSTSHVSSDFCSPKLPPVSAKARRSSATSVSSKSSSRRLSLQANTRYTKNRPIAPNTNPKVTNSYDVVGSNMKTVLPTVNAAAIPTMIQPNTVLAQVIPAGSFGKLNDTPISQSSSVKIMNTVTCTKAKLTDNLVSTSSFSKNSIMAPTVLISPVTLATMTGMTDFQSRVLVGAANQVFTSNSKIPSLPSSSVKVEGGGLSQDGSGSSQTSSSKVGKVKSPAERAIYKEHRRVVHITAEQKRRFNIKYGFDVIQNLVPSINQNPSLKISKAQMLHKAADYIRHLKVERSEMMSETERLKTQIESLNEAINTCQAQLPITGAPVASPNTNMTDMFEEYVRLNTLQNWKFWIFSLIIRPLFEKYHRVVNTSNMEEFCSRVLSWLDQYCSLVFLRPAVSNSLRLLSTTTDILSNPSSIEQEATKAVSKVPLHNNR